MKTHPLKTDYDSSPTCSLELYPILNKNGKAKLTKKLNTPFGSIMDRLLPQTGEQIRQETGGNYDFLETSVGTGAKAGKPKL